MTLAVTFVGNWPPNLRDAAERVQAALQQEYPDELPTGTINLKLVRDAEMLALNTQYSGVPEPTDVLTFNYAEGREADSPAVDGELADIAISTETADRQAVAAGVTLPDEVGLLVAHGLLHALGRDHQTTAERQDLEALQRRLLEAANLTYRELPWKD